MWDISYFVVTFYVFIFFLLENPSDVIGRVLNISVEANFFYITSEEGWNYLNPSNKDL